MLLLLLFGKRAVAITTATRRQGSHSMQPTSPFLIDNSELLDPNSKLWLIDSS
jgi:hypothetical protein